MQIRQKSEQIKSVDQIPKPGSFRPRLFIAILLVGLVATMQEAGLAITFLAAVSFWASVIAVLTCLLRAVGLKLSPIEWVAILGTVLILAVLIVCTMAVPALISMRGLQ